MRFIFIECHREQYPVARMCRLLEVTRSGFYSWRRRPESVRSRENLRLLFHIRAIHRSRREVYGSPRMHAELRASGWGSGRNRVARLMRQNGIRPRSRRQFRITTRSRRSDAAAPDLLRRQFTADRPNQSWVADITYIRTREGWLYLAVLMDLFSRMIVGWAMSERLTAALAVEALKMALSRRCPPTNLIHHSDRGSQYASEPYREILGAHGIRASMSRAGNCWDNAVMESAFGTMKRELVNHRDYRCRAEARTDIFEYIEVFYNRQRRHSSLGYVSPADFEAVVA